MVKGYLTIIEAKLLQPVNETFFFVPTDGANCCCLDRLYSWASAMQRKPAKRKGGPTMVGCQPLQWLCQQKCVEEEEGFA